MGSNLLGASDADARLVQGPATAAGRVEFGESV
jgi:hypothetical protein